MVAYKNIFQTDFKEPGELTQKWRDMNAADGWKLDWYDDARSEAWVRETFESAEEIEKGGVWWAYDYFKRGVLKADLLRYLLPLVKGGVYADVDVSSSRTTPRGE
jgi:mannosyltransferase OCH1-like enzyme